MATEAALPFARQAPSRRQPGDGRWILLVLMLLALPVFLQSFQYMKDIRLLWAFAKASPVLLLPLVVLGLTLRGVPHKALYLALLTYLLLVTPMLTMFHLDATLTEALGATVKIWSFTFYFSMIATLVLLDVDEKTLARALAVLAVVNFGTLWFLWVVVPETAYVTDITVTGMFFWDQERGPRIMLPLAFGTFGILWMGRRFAVRPAIWPVALIVLTFVLMLVIYKQRTVIANTLLLVLWGMSGQWRWRHPLSFWTAAVLGAALLIGLLPLLSTLETGAVRDSLGGSLTTRTGSANVLIDHLEQNPFRWIFGIGGTTDLNEVGLEDLFRKRDFFMSDLGWLGVFGEYGVVGGTIIAAVYLLAWRETIAAARASPTPMRLALQDFAVFLIMTTAIYSVTYTPGQIAAVMALAVYLQRLPPSGVPSAAVSRATAPGYRSALRPAG